jgi:hypothetical protein
VVYLPPCGFAIRGDHLPSRPGHHFAVILVQKLPGFWWKGSFDLARIAQKVPDAFGIFHGRRLVSLRVYSHEKFKYGRPVKPESGTPKTNFTKMYFGEYEIKSFSARLVVAAVMQFSPRAEIAYRTL